MHVSIPRLDIPNKSCTLLAMENSGYDRKPNNLSCPTDSAQQDFACSVPHTNVILGPEGSKSKTNDTNLPPLNRESTVQNKDNNHVIRHVKGMEPKHGLQGTNQKHRRVVVGLRTQIKPDLNLKKRSSIFRPRSLGQSIQAGKSNSAVGNFNRSATTTTGCNEKVHRVLLPTEDYSNRGFQKMRENKNENSRCIHLLPRETWNTGFRENPPKRIPKKPDIRLTLMDITAFLPKQQGRSSTGGSWQDSTKRDHLTGQNVQATELMSVQKEVILADSALLPSKPSFIEIRQTKGQILKSNLQRTHAWATRDLTTVKDLSKLANFCDEDKTDMILKWLDTGKDKFRHANSLEHVEELNTPSRTTHDES